jgi:hypothetical protein
LIRERKSIDGRPIDREETGGKRSAVCGKALGAVVRRRESKVVMRVRT